jgi:hypothetical protein
MVLQIAADTWQVGDNPDTVIFEVLCRSDARK